MTIADLLRVEGYEVDTAPDGIRGLDRALRGGIDLIVLDVMLPGKNGYEVCRELRHRGHDTPILMLTAKTQVVDRVVGLKIGADDYLTKPFDPSELLARIEALLRRTMKETRPAVITYEFDGIQVNFETGEVMRGEEHLALTAKELQLLRYLIEHRGHVVSREELLQRVWEYQSEVNSRTVDVHVAWLRQKLEANPGHPKHIHTVRGVGYRFAG